MHRFVRTGLAAATMGFVALAPGFAMAAKVRIAVDLDAQTMHVESGAKTFDWKVSSGKFGYDTPAGTYHVLWMDKDHHSDEYDQAPMPNAIFFAPGYAIHGAYKSSWGHPASHGCVRLPVAKSAILFDMVKAQGADITVTGGPPADVVAARAHHDDAPPPDRGAVYRPDDTRGYADVPDGAAPSAGARGDQSLFGFVY